MDFSAYYIARSLEDCLSRDVISESDSVVFDTAKFVRDSRKKAAFERHVLDFSRKYPHARSCDVEDAIDEALSSVVKKRPKSASSAKKILARRVDEILSEISKRGKDAKKRLACLKSIKSSSVKGLDLSSLVGKARGILTSKEKIALELCMSGHSAREMGRIMGMAFPTAWRVLNKAIDKVRVSHGMKSRYKDRR